MPTEVREFFAYLPRLTNTGWAWLVDVREVWTRDHLDYPNFRWQKHLERVRAR